MSSQTVYQPSPNILVRQSSLYQTNSGIVLAGGKAALVDPGIFKTDLDELDQLRKPHPIAFGLITHAHWDHILWSPRFDPAPRYCSIGTDYHLQLDETSLRAQLQQAEQENGSQFGAWDQARFFDRQVLVPGTYDLESFHFEVVELPGHCPGQAGFVFKDQSVVFVADTLSDAEVPTVPDRASIAIYLETLNQLELIIQQLHWVVPGHGSPATSLEALQRLALDRAYLSSLARFNGFSSPVNRETEARSFLDRLGETRANLEPGWSMHLENLDNVSR